MYIDSGGFLRDDDLYAQLLQPMHVASNQRFSILSIVVIRSQVLMDNLVLKQVVYDDQQSVRQSDRCTFRSPARGDPVITDGPDFDTL